MNFINFQKAIYNQANRIQKNDSLFTVRIDKDDFWNHYLASFLEGSNPIFRERTEHDCNCCRHFIKTLGNVITIKDGKIESIWDVGEIKDEPEYTKQVLSAISSLPEVKTKTHKLEKTFTPDTKPVVLIQQTNNSQAEIKIGFKYKTNDNLRDEIIFRILSSLLSKNAFNDLREKQQLAYHVNSYTKNCAGNTNMLFCNILTTTEDNETGEQMYDNLQKSINGYKKLIEDLKNGNFTDEELNAIKLEHKGNLLAATESDNGKTSIISSDLSSVYGPLSTNLKYSIIDTITKEEIIKAANYIFRQPPIYGITATKNTLSANAKYFKELEDC